MTKFNYNAINAKSEARNIVLGKKMVDEGHYSILNTQTEEGEEKTYYVRQGNRWIEDPAAEVLCNMNDKCISNSNIDCVSLQDKIRQVSSKNMKDLMSESGKLQKVELEIMQQYLKKYVAEMDFLHKYYSAKKLVYNNEKITLGNQINEASFTLSPFEKMRDTIISDTNIITKYTNLQVFVTTYTRTCLKGTDESKYWLYCVQSGVKLLPTFMYDLANSFITYDNYSEKMKQICAEQGAKSDDGCAWVDRHSGYIIKNIGF